MPSADRLLQQVLYRVFRIDQVVIHGRDGGQRLSVQVAVNKIKKKADLPKDFRPLHGLRHVYASMLASSGKVDMYTLRSCSPIKVRS
ncbi:MAG: hypothetical protein QF732_00815 [Nitrospinaceae bacterium]|jgi:integrase|nr:hypothetical protein [Nitrospinaceae bacterium]